LIRRAFVLLITLDMQSIQGLGVIEPHVGLFKDSIILTILVRHWFVCRSRYNPVVCRHEADRIVEFKRDRQVSENDNTSMWIRKPFGVNEE